ncbi:MAG: endonuclease/exonuclease/phosphatase family protein [Bacteroidales bacterium]|nr:endonuclease/exonuclease/phosphatase family protein [Bacteroidales bacterium]
MSRKNNDRRPHRGDRGFFRELRKFIMVFLNLLTVLLLLLSAKLSCMSPELWILSSYPNYLFLVLVLVNLCFFVYWIFRRNLWLLLSLCFFILTWPEFRSWLPLQAPWSKENSDTEVLLNKGIKLLTYNTMQFSGYQPHSSRNSNKVIEYIRHVGADIVCLQEAGYMKSDRYLTREAVLKALSSYPYQAELPGEKQMNLWVFSKYPIVRVERILYESRSNASFFCDVKIEDKMIRLINNHLESNRLTQQDKNLYKEIIDSPDKESVSHVARELGRKLTPAAVIRARQAEAVSRAVQESPYPVIVCGDFNDIPNSYTYRRMGRGLTDAWKQHASGLGVTFHEKFYRFRIDYIMHSPSLRSFGTHIDRVDYSDHYPLWTYFLLP